MEFDVISDMVQKASAAQKKLETCSQKYIDEIVKAIAKTVFDNAEVLASMAVDETSMGIYGDKVEKNRRTASMLWHSLKGKKSVGAVEEDAVNGIIKIAKPMGVVGAVTPCTNPITTPMCIAMFAVKARNSIIIAPHPRARKCAAYTAELINMNLKTLGAPENLIQTIEDPNVLKSRELMSSVDVVVAIGGSATVKAAYSCGKPAFGVGAGNAQCIIDRGVCISESVEKIINGRIFDNGIISSAEQMILVHNDDFAETVKELESQGAYFVRNSDEALKLRNLIFDEEGNVSKEVVGQPVSKLAYDAGIELEDNVRLIVIEVYGAGEEELFCREKLFPVIGLKRYETFEEAVAIAAENIEAEGMGHSVVIHSGNDEHIRYAGENLNVSRLLVNQVGATMSGGSYLNGLVPTTIFGCGTWGNNIISDNFNYTHLMNITRISTVIDGVVMPSEEEIWADV